jgi:hypothetical protein
MSISVDLPRKTIALAYSGRFEDSIQMVSTFPFHHRYLMERGCSLDLLLRD